MHREREMMPDEQESMESRSSEPAQSDRDGRDAQPEGDAWDAILTRMLDDQLYEFQREAAQAPGGGDGQPGQVMPVAGAGVSPAVQAAAPRIGDPPADDQGG
jgi:hypothetical protein